MEKKVFRLHEGNKDTGWFRSIKPDFSKVNTDGKKVATSIPSPFAQIDLVKSAFKWVADNGIDGKTAQHKLVSDALDIGQIFFISNRLKDKIDILSWDPEIRLTDLLNSTNKNHTELAKTFSVFWEQDAEIYNFDKVNRLYFILNKQGELLGGTSPATLFFAAPDAHKYCPEIHCGADVMLDTNYYSLAQREPSFVEYIFSLSVYPGFTKYFKEFSSYLNSVRKQLSPGMQNNIHKLAGNAYAHYKPCAVQNNLGDTCEALNIPLGTEPDMKDKIKNESDFLIHSTLYEEEYPPLILPDERFNKNYIYTSSGVKWDANSPKITANNQALDDSVLPFQEHRYPWLTKGNFLQDKIVKLPYQIDSNKFELAGANNFLLPLTSTFFQYFEVKQIPELLTIHEQSTGGVEVSLKIPVSGGDVTFKKIYHETDQVNIELHLAILPFMRVDSFPVKHTVGLLHSESQEFNSGDLLISFIEKGVTYTPSDSVVRSPGEGTLKSIYQSIEGKFDSIKVLHKSFGEAFIIPKLQKYHQGGDSFKFAIDFGTTNTHIEYKKSGLKEIVLTNSPPSTYWTSLLDIHSNPDQLYIINEKTFEQELMPLSFGQNDDGFPLRTALVENFNIDFTKPVEVFKHINNFLLYDRQLKQGHLNLHTKLKWSDYHDPIEQKRVEAYIEYLLWLIFFKVLLENGDLSRTEIIWFHPVSMTTYQQNVLEGKWKQLYQKVFGKFANEKQIKKVAESIAPFYYYHNRMGVLGLSVSIDVGGGSSDIAIFDHGQAEFISSFRYAGDAIFGDGYGGSPSINGFVKRFREQAKIFLENNDSDKLKILEHIIEARGDSADFSSFLFSLSAKDQSSFNYEDLIKNDQSLKLSILLFYSSLAFYVARFMKLAGYSTPPKNILFSGTGSKTLSLLDSSSFENISNLFENIFNHVFNKTETHIEILQAPFPKEITCKGGLLTNNILNQPPVKFWIGGVDNPKVSNVVDSKNLQDVPRYNQINDGEKESIVNSIIEFYELLDNFFENTRIDNVFGIKREAYEIFREMRENELIQFFEKGIEVKTKEEGNDENLPLEETLFFYPLVGVLNKLTCKLSKL